MTESVLGSRCTLLLDTRVFPADLRIIEENWECDVKLCKVLIILLCVVRSQGKVHMAIYK